MKVGRMGMRTCDYWIGLNRIKNERMVEKEEEDERTWTEKLEIIDGLCTCQEKLMMS